MEKLIYSFDKDTVRSNSNNSFKIFIFNRINNTTKYKSLAKFFDLLLEYVMSRRIKALFVEFIQSKAFC